MRSKYPRLYRQKEKRKSLWLTLFLFLLRIWDADNLMECLFLLQVAVE